MSHTPFFLPLLIVLAFSFSLFLFCIASPIEQRAWPSGLPLLALSQAAKQPANLCQEWNFGKKECGADLHSVWRCGGEGIGWKMLDGASGNCALNTNSGLHCCSPGGDKCSLSSYSKDGLSYCVGK